MNRYVSVSSFWNKLAFGYFLILKFGKSDWNKNYITSKKLKVENTVLKRRNPDLQN